MPHLGRLACPGGAPRWPRRLRPSGGVGPRPSPQVGGPETGAGVHGEPHLSACGCYIAHLHAIERTDASRAISRAPGGAGRVRTRPQFKVLSRAIQRCACGGLAMDRDGAVSVARSAKHAVSSACLHGTRPWACCAHPIAAAAEHIIGDMAADPAPHSRCLPDVAGSPCAAIRCDCILTR